MFVRNDMPQFHRLDIDDFSMDNSDGRIELIGLEVTINKEKWVFISIYKQPKVKIIHLVEIMDNIMIQLSQQDINIVFIGDFNVNMLQRNELSDCLKVNGLRNLVKNPTCFKSTPSLIDLIITNKPKRFKSTVCADTGLSDFHSLACTATKIQVPKLKPVTFR